MSLPECQRIVADLELRKFACEELLNPRHRLNLAGYYDISTEELQKFLQISAENCEEFAAKWHLALMDLYPGKLPPLRDDQK